MVWERQEIGPAVVLFGDRTGGVSAPPYATANAGYLTGDDRANVDENRRRLGASVGGAATELDAWVRIRQVHGARVLTPSEARAARRERDGEPVEADGAVITVSDTDTALAVLTADCAPVAFVGARGAALVHAGWRGTVGGVLAAAVTELRCIDDGPLDVVIGPLAQPCCYEFGPDDLAVIAAELGDGVRAVTRAGRPALDQPAAIRAALAGSGIDAARVRSVGRCTICDPDCFSHRRDGTPGPTGRQASVLVLGR